MRIMHTIAAALVVAMLFTSGARAADDAAYARLMDHVAEDEAAEAAMRKPDPGAALGAALINVVYLPARIGLTMVGGVVAGLSGFLTAGNWRAANNVFRLFDGSQVVTPGMLSGHEQFHWTGLD